MIVEIDQSGKVEDTGRDTVIAFSNGKSRSIRISARDKRKVQVFFRSIGKSQVFVYRTFAVLVWLLIKNDLVKIHDVIIDTEYPGQDSVIKNYLLGHIRTYYPNFSSKDISFMLVGKRSRAHVVAYSTYTKRRKADVEVTAQDVFDVILN